MINHLKGEKGRKLVEAIHDKLLHPQILKSLKITNMVYIIR